MNINCSLKNPLGRTALFICASRALESKKERPLFVDPYAESLAGNFGIEFFTAMAKELPFEAPLEVKIEFFGKDFAVRTAFFDEHISKTIKEKAIDQLVILAVGGDSRPYRLDCLKGCTTFEIDFPEVIEYRKNVLDNLGAQPKGKLVSISIDLNDPSWSMKLKELQFDCKKKTIFLVEGLLMYLTFEEVDLILKQISDLCSEGSVLFGDIINREYVEYIQKFKSWQENQSNLKSHCSRPDELLGKFGFDCKYYRIGEHKEAQFGKFDLLQEVIKADLKQYFVFSALKK